MRLRPVLMLMLLGMNLNGYARSVQKEQLYTAIHRIIDTAHAHIGVGILGLDFEDSLLINGSDAFPMQSVFKFPLALAMLHQAEQRKQSLSAPVSFSRKSLEPNTWSPLLKEHPETEITLSLGELLRYSVSKSDNNACDILFGLAGGTAAVDRYIHSLGIKGISIKATEAEMRKAWKVQYTNSSQPGAMLQLLRLFYNGSLLSKSGNAFLMDLMIQSENPADRIKGLLPANAQVAHKTGTSDTNEKGLTAATNDVGILTLPDGRHVALVIYVSDYNGGVKAGSRIIAGIARLVWDHYSKEDQKRK